MPKCITGIHQARAKAIWNLFNKSAVTEYIAQANHVIDWEGKNVVDRKNNQGLRQVKEAIRISHAMNRDQAEYNLSKPSPVTSGGQGHSVMMELDENRNWHSYAYFFLN